MYKVLRLAMPLNASTLITVMKLDDKDLNTVRRPQADMYKYWRLASPLNASAAIMVMEFVSRRLMTVSTV